MRGLYLLFAVLAALAISYQGYLGGKLVYDYGIGTALYNAASSSPSPQPEATGPATPIPTVYVPTATVTPEAASPTTAASASATASAMPVPPPRTPPRRCRAESCCAAERLRRRLRHPLQATSTGASASL